MNTKITGKNAKRIMSALLSFVLFSSIFSSTVYGADGDVVEAYRVRDASLILNGRVIQKFEMAGAVNMDYIANMKETGIVYSSTDEEPELDEPDVSSVLGIVTYNNQIAASTDEVEEETLYYARLYVTYNDNSTDYSDVMEYRTAIVTEPGTRVGCELIVSGGYYYHDNGTTDSASYHQAMIDDGFSALYNGNVYQSAGRMTRPGFNSLITEDSITGKRYLHVFHLTLGDRSIVETMVDIRSESDSFNRISAYFTFDNFDELDCEEGGILYSDDTFKLENAVNNVTKHPGHYINGSYTTAPSDPVADNTDYYVRTYVKINGRYHYGKNIYMFTTGTNTEAGELKETIPITETGYTTSYETQLPLGCSAVIGNSEYEEGDNIKLDATGNYYILTTWSGGSRSATHVRIDKTVPVLENIQQNEIFNSTVTPICEEDNVQFYLRKDSENDKDFASGVRISEPGDYALTLIGPGYASEIYYFSIKDPVVTTQDCFSVTTDSAELSANFVNNGSILERGFVYSSINNDPKIGAIGAIGFVPAQDPEPGFITATLSGLAVFTTYYFRGYVKTGTTEEPSYTYGDVKEFTTPSLGTPLVMIGYPKEVKRNNLLITASVLQSGGSEVTERGLVFSINQGPTIGGDDCTKIPANASGVGDYEVNLSGLSPNTLYYVRAYAINGSGTGYSADSVFSSGPEYTVTFDLSGGTRTGGGELIQSGDPGFSPNAPTTIKADSNFGGWDKSFDSVEESMTVAALWTDNKTYQVRFDLDGGTRTGGGELSQLVSPGFAAEAPAAERSGYDFKGWDKAFTNINAYTEIKAKWEIKKYNVYFALDGGTRTGGGALAQVVEHGSAATAPTAEKEGSTFSGWDVSFDNVTKGLTVTALWNTNIHKVTFNKNGGTKTGGGDLVQLIPNGEAAIAPVIEREGYTFVGWDVPFDNVTGNVTVNACFAAILLSEEDWTTQVQVSVDAVPDGIPLEIDLNNDQEYSSIPENSSVNILENKLINARAYLNGTWITLPQKNISNIDNDHPTQPTATYHLAPESNQFSVSFGSSTDVGSGVALYEYKIGKFGEWKEYAPPFSMNLPNGTDYVIRAKDFAGNGSNQLSSVVNVKPLGFTDAYGHSATRYILDEQRDGTSIHRINLMGGYDTQQKKFEEYTYYPTNESYKGCGVKAAQIFVRWFGIELPQGVVNDYVETTDFDKYIDWLTGDTWADPGIFTTPAQLDSGIQDILDEYYDGYTVVRNSPDSSTPAIERIETGLASGFPVIVLVNDGSHWQVITACRITRIHGDEINTAQFLVHDNGGEEWRTWADLDYFFEDNTSAEAARLMGYDSYWDTILSVQYTPPGGANGSGNSSGGTNAGGGAGNVISEGILIAPSAMNGSAANAALTHSNIADAIQASQGNGLVEITVNAPADSESVTISIPRSSIGDLSGADVDTHISTPLAGMRFDSEAMSAISNAAGGDISITAGTVDTGDLSQEVRWEIAGRPVFEFAITSNGQPISDFGEGTVTVSVPYKPEFYEDPNNIVIYYIGSDGSLKTIPGCSYDPTTGRVTFATNHFSSYAVGYKEMPFSDVASFAWYAGSVNFAAARNLFSGVGNGRFDPEGNMTRAMFASVLARLDGAELSTYETAPEAISYKDVGKDKWYSNAIRWATKKGIISGVGEGRFEPEAYVTREQMAAMLYRYTAYRQNQLSSKKITPFEDAADISPWAVESVNAMQGYGFVCGNEENRYLPKDNISRAEAANVLERYIKKTLE